MTNRIHHNGYLFHGIVKALHVSAIADYCEEWSNLHGGERHEWDPNGGDWMDSAPPFDNFTFQPWLGTLESLAYTIIHEYFIRQGWPVIPVGHGLRYDPHPASPMARSFQVQFLTNRVSEAIDCNADEVERWGHYLAMQAMGHGVAWTDDRDDLEVAPLTDFGSIVETPEFGNPEWYSPLPISDLDEYYGDCDSAADWLRFNSIAEDYDGDEYEAFQSAMKAVVYTLLSRSDIDADAPGYAEPGYSDPELGVLMANWNRYSREFCDAIERAGYELEWSDEWTTTTCCNKAIRTKADSYGWTPSYVEMDGDLICMGCLEEEAEDYISTHLVGNPNNAMTPTTRDALVGALQEMGFEPSEVRLERGFHRGQVDSPQKFIDAMLKHHPDVEVVFEVMDVGQFDVRFTYWTKAPEGYEWDPEDPFPEREGQDAPGQSIAERTEQGLQAAAKAMRWRPRPEVEPPMKPFPDIRTLSEDERAEVDTQWSHHMAGTYSHEGIRSGDYRVCGGVVWRVWDVSRNGDLVLITRDRTKMMTVPRGVTREEEV